MHLRPETWTFGPIHHFSDEHQEWWARHAPTVDRWLTELEGADDPWWPSAAHAAHCLVSNREMNVAEPTWDGFDVGEFLFDDLWNGGTHGMFGSSPIFFDHCVEALRRFAADGLIERDAAETWLAQLTDARPDFVRCFDEKTDELESLAIAAKYRPSVATTPSVEPPPPVRRLRPARKKRRLKHPRRRVRRPGGR